MNDLNVWISQANQNLNLYRDLLCSKQNGVPVMVRELARKRFGCVLDIRGIPLNLGVFLCTLGYLT